jgi:oxalate decarboxylase
MAKPTRSDVPEPVRDGLGATIMGPRNVAVETENPNLLRSPYTDAGTIPNLKFPFSNSRNRLLTGGWAREVTQLELPVATTISGVDMRLKPGAIRELHWHKQAEWAYMLAGNCRVTCIDPEGRNFIDDLGVGDLWNFRSGYPHSIQALGEGCEFLIAFDDGSFSENNTFLLTDWFHHTPLPILAKNLGVSESALAEIPTDPDHQRYIFNGQVPPALAQDAVRSPAGSSMSMTYPMLRQDPIEVPGGRVWIVDSHTFPAASTIAAALVELDPGAMRELHWHPNNDEWQYYISGRGQMTVFASSGMARTFDYQAGDVGYVPFPMGHYLLNTGQEKLRVLELFRSDHYADVSLNQWLGLTPPELTQAHLNLDQSTTAAVTANKNKQFIVR